jgi:hypothetical protein
MDRKLKTAIVPAALLSGLLVTAPGAAQAASNSAPAVSAVSVSVAQTSAAGTAPACIRRNNNNLLKNVLVINTCGKTMRVKVLIRLGPDSGCWRMAAGSSRYHNYVGYYQRVVTC